MKGDVIIMGDFNEVRYSNERVGSNFNVKGANAFNSFIIQAGLKDIPLGGCSFLSDHQPILLRESTYDYGPIPFRFFKYWVEVDGFEKLLVETWSDTATCGSNDMLNLMYKLKNLKKKMRGWNSVRQSFKNSKIMLKSKLADVELVIDEGNASEEIIYKRLEIVNSINELEKQQAMETTQKTKIKWAIKGDENSKYYHGILIKKRNNLAIRRVFEAGKWIKNPDLVKKEFLSHFKNRFGRPNKTRHVLVTEFPCQLNSMQRMDMEADVTIEEIKNAVWDCGTDKSLELDGFSFDFYRFQNVVDAGMFKGIVLNSSMVLSERCGVCRIGCGILEVPFTYLGSKVVGCMSLIQNWNDVVENMSSRLSK
nr:RNA-directed DNA polymerase, eukaryota [Tanacetum cinerariifolium]